MGARLSLLAPSAPTVAVSSYVDILNSIQFLELINNSRFLKTIKAFDRNGGNLIIIKILIKSSDETNLISLQQVTELIAKQCLLLSHFPNVLPWHKLIETDRGGYMIRQLIKTNLYDRLSIRPFLLPIEKSFIIFQMLMIIKKIHELQIYHGDLKLENFLITSWNWLLLSDFATYTKPVFIPEDNPNQFSFYFDNSARRVCYIAPERFYNSKQTSPPTQTIDNNGSFTGKDRLTLKMDLFSLGCAIAEFYADGEPTFTLSQIFKYIKGNYHLSLSNISNKYVKEMVFQLISLNPDDRVNPEILLHQYRDKLFPGFFYDFLYDFMTELNSNDSFIVKDLQHLTINDLKICKIYNDFDKIIHALNFKYDTISNHNPHSSMIPYKLNLSGMPSNYTIKPGMFVEETLDHPSLILLMVFSMMKTLKQPSSKIKACELILALSERIDDESKLDRSLPYLCSVIDEFIELSSTHQECSTKVACTAISCITTLLISCSYITPINVLVFPEYLLPKLSSLLLLNLPISEKSAIKIAIAASLPYLAIVSKKFWMMSKTFKHDTLKAYESKILGFSVGGGTNDYSSFSIPKDQLDAEFETITNSILTDFDILVKISLINNILPLCQFFGVEKTNDIILPHLITYLNDSSVELKIAFLNSIIKISGFIGILTFEQYILPLLIQTLADPEPFVILKVLEIFNDIVSKRLINPRVEFNALGIYIELLENTTAYLLHPIEWIRQSVLCLVVSISESLADADRYCILYPLIKKFLKYDVSEITWNSLYPYLVRPLSSQLFEKTILWASNASNKSLFWQQILSSAQSTKSAGHNVLSFSHMGKSVYLPKNSSDINHLIANEKISKISLSPEDRHWIFKLRSVGFEEKNLWKLHLLRDYFYHISKVKTNFEESMEHVFLNLSTESNVAPRNIFIDINYKSEPLNVNKTTEASVESTFSAEAISLQEHDSKGNSTLVLPNIGRVKASIQTVEANVFGEMELSHESSSFHHLRNSATNVRKDHTLTHVLYSVNNLKIVTSNLNISYKGHNPFIINYLESLNFEPDISNFPEFGSFIKTPLNRDIDLTSQKATHIARINTNHSNDWVEGINKVVVSPSSEFFITTSETGSIKVWDSYRIDRLVSARNASLSINLNSCITCIKFIPNRFVFAVGTLDGQIRLFRIEVVRGKNKKITKYSRIKLIRHIRLTQDDEFVNYPTDFEFLISDKHSVLLGTSSSSKIFSIDILRMQIDFEVEIPIFYGVPLSLVYGEKSWVLVGTNKGVLFLWDFRFKILVKSWRLEEKQSKQRQNISKIVLLPKINSETDPLSFVIQCGTNITIWEIPSFDCKQILTARSIDSTDRKFILTEINCKFDLNNLDDIFAEFDLNFEVDGEIDSNELTAMTIFKQGKQLLILSATVDKIVNLWNMIDFNKSFSINIESSKFIQSAKSTSTIVKEYSRETKFKITDQLKFHQDIITDICIITNPYEMVVSVDRSGLIQIFRLD